MRAHLTVCMLVRIIMDMNETTIASRTINTAHDTTTITVLEGGIVETLSAPIDRPGSRAFTREKRYAHRQVEGKGTACIDLNVSRSDDGRSYYVRWSSNRGRGWGKACRKTCGTEAEAKLFAASKWVVMLAWLAKVDPVSARPIDIMSL